MPGYPNDPKRNYLFAIDRLTLSKARSGKKDRLFIYTFAFKAFFESDEEP